MIVEQITILRGLLRRASSISRHQHGQGFLYTQRVFKARTRCAVAIYHTFPCAIDQGKDFGQQRLFPGVTGTFMRDYDCNCGAMEDRRQRNIAPANSADVSGEWTNSEIPDYASIGASTSPTEGDRL